MRVIHLSIVWQYMPAEALLLPLTSVRLAGPAFQSDFASFIFVKAENFLSTLVSMHVFVNVMEELTLITYSKNKCLLEYLLLRRTVRNGTCVIAHYIIFSSW